MQTIRIALFSLMILLGLTSMYAAEDEEVPYKEYQAANNAYKVEIPSDFKLLQAIGESLVLSRDKGNNEDLAAIVIRPTYDGFLTFEKELVVDPDIKFTIYHSDDNLRFAQYTDGKICFFNLGMIKNIAGVDYLISLTSQDPKSVSEQMIQHILGSMTKVTPGEIVSDKALDKGCQVPVDGKMITYSNPFLKIMVPDSWESETPTHLQEDAYYFNQEGTLSLEIIRLNAPETLTDFVMDFISEVEAAGFRIISTSSVLIYGLDGQKLVYTSYSNPKTITTDYFFKKNGTIFLLMFICYEGTLDLNSLEIEKVINTFEAK